MKIFHSLSSGMRAIFHRTRTEREMDEELDALLEASAAEKRRSGMPPGEAVRAAHVEMGSTSEVKHHIRSAAWETHSRISGSTCAIVCASSCVAQSSRWLLFFIAAVSLLGGFATPAGLIPARKASLVEPAVALRCE